MRSMQVSRAMSRSRLYDAVETNLRLVSFGGGLRCRTVQIESTDRSPDLAQKVCSRLRIRGVVAVPRNRRELLVPASTTIQQLEHRGDGWHAVLKPDSHIVLLDLANSSDRDTAVDFVQKTIVTALERAGEYWWFSESTRYWYGYQPVAKEDGIEMLPRFSFATHAVGEDRVGVAIDFSHTFQTEKTLADFLVADEGIRRFNLLRKRSHGKKGTLIYDVGSNRRSKCYFSDFAKGKTCSTSGVIIVGTERYESLYDYYRKVRPRISVNPDDSIVYVSFERMGRPVLVAAKLVRMRVQLDPQHLPRPLRRLSMSPEERRRRNEKMWTGTIRTAIEAIGGRVATELWRPSPGDFEQLLPPDLIFGNNRVLRSPRNPELSDYNRYFRQREELLKGGGLYRFEHTVPQEILFVVPNLGGRWSGPLQDAFSKLFRDILQDIVGSTFRLGLISISDTQQIVQQLSTRTPTTAVVVFDERDLDSSAYYLLSEQLQEKQGWLLKRITRRTLEDAWHAKSNARTSEERTRAERGWRDVVYHSVLDVLDQMDAVPYRIASFGYDACLAIDVSAFRRYFGLSLLICRNPATFPGAAGFQRIIDSWPKHDVDRDEINSIVLEDRIAEIVDGLAQRQRFTELQSLLVLRDGKECGAEPQAIDRALSRWMRAGVLSQSAQIDVVAYQKRTVKDLRIWCHAQETANALEGTAVYMAKNVALLCCTGAASIHRRATADPCRLIGREGVDIRRAAAAVFALAQHNYLSPKKAYRDAQPIRDLDRELEQRMAMEVRGLRA